MRIPVVGIGAGGHSKAIIEILNENGAYEVVGLLDPKVGLHGQNISDIEILGGDELLSELKKKGVEHFFVGLGGAGDNRPRQRLFDEVVSAEFKPINVVHLRAIISPSVALGLGVTIMAGAVINADSRLGDNVIVNTGAIIEHDCVIGDHVHVATGAQLAGTVEVGEGAHIGAGSVIKQGISIGRNAIVGAGAAVVKDVADGTIVAGVPASVIGESKDREK